MEKTRAEIRVESAAWSAHGADKVEFLIAPNRGRGVEAAGEDCERRRAFARGVGAKNLHDRPHQEE